MRVDFTFEEKGMSLKKGDLVEVIGSDSGMQEVVGLRFTLEFYEELYSITTGEVIYAWLTPIIGFAARECYLRKVNPDGDELSDESFESLMSKLKYFNKEANIITVNIKLEENT